MSRSEIVRRSWATRKRNAWAAYVARLDAKRGASKANREAKAARLAQEQARASRP